MMFRLLLLLCLGHCLPAVLEADVALVAKIGGTVTLPCDGAAATDTKEVDVLWMVDNKPACWYKNGSRCETGHYVNRTLLGSKQQNNFSLVIDPVKENDEGEYMCEVNNEVKQTTRLIVKGDGKREDAETPLRGGRNRRDAATAHNVCRPYRDGEDLPGSETDKQHPDENLPGPTSGRERVFVVSVGMLVIALVGGAALFTKQRWNWQRDKKLPNLRPSEANLINGDSV